jgi:predicted transcriptional regulator
MAKKLPQEIETWYLIPAIRKELGKELIAKGLSQKETSVKLGLTEAAVSQYVSKKRATGIKFDKEISGEIKKAVERIMDGKGITKEIHDISEMCRKSGMLCKIHKKHEKIEGRCELCMR